jgi:hypothetical protein
MVGGPVAGAHFSEFVRKDDQVIDRRGVFRWLGGALCAASCLWPESAGADAARLLPIAYKAKRAKVPADSGPPPLPALRFPLHAPSAPYFYPEDFLSSYSGFGTTGDVLESFADRLESDRSYWGRRFFSIPHGAALTMPFERILPDGTPVQGPTRFHVDIPETQWWWPDWLKSSSVPDWLKSSYVYEEVRIRAFVFAISTERGTDGTIPSSFERQRDKLRSGELRADGPLMTPALTRKHRLSAKIYEWVSIDGRPYEYVPRSAISGQQHLDYSGIATGKPALPK